MPTVPIPNDFFHRLIVRDADAAIGFCRNALGAELVERFAEQDGRVVHAKLTLGGFSLSLSEEAPDWRRHSRMSLGGSPVLIQLEFTDCDMVAAKKVSKKAEKVVPLKDRPHGKRDGRIRDPFGHLWILSQQVAA